MVKSCRDADKAQYVQYVYDVQGNKVRQFIGMTSPLTITVSEVTDADTSSGSEMIQKIFSLMQGKLMVLPSVARRNPMTSGKTSMPMMGKPVNILYRSGGQDGDLYL